MVCKAFMTRTRCFLLVLSVLLTSSCSVVSATRSLKAVQHPQDDDEVTRRLELAHTDGDELQSEGEGGPILGDDEARTLKGFFSGLKTKIGWKSKGEIATAKAADGVLQRAKSTTDGDGLVEKAKTAGKVDEASALSRNKKWYRGHGEQIIGGTLLLGIIAAIVINFSRFF